jgi:transposase
MEFSRRRRLRPPATKTCLSVRAGKLRTLRSDVVLCQDDVAGEKLFVDYARATIPFQDRQGGPERQASIFVAVLGAGNYTYAEATESQELKHWIGSHIRTFEFLGGVPKLVVPDFVPGNKMQRIFSSAGATRTPLECSSTWARPVS